MTQALENEFDLDFLSDFAVNAKSIEQNHHTYAVITADQLASQDAANENDLALTDTVLLVLPSEACPFDEHNNLVHHAQATVSQNGQMQWDGAFNRTHFIGSNTAPLPDAIHQALASEHGLLTLFINPSDAQVEHIATFYSANYSQ